MTLDELRDLVRTLANVDENRLSDDVADLFIQQAVDEIMTTERLRFGEERVTTAFSEGVGLINPAGTRGRIVSVIDMYYAGTDDLVQVKQISWPEYSQRYGTDQADSTTFGAPCHFAIFSEDNSRNPIIYVGPIPDEDVTPVYLDARISFTMDDDDDENQLSRGAPLAIVYKALIHAASHLESVERVGEWSALYESVIMTHRLSDSHARRSAMHARSMEEAG